jgi:hypothetical protein
MVTLAGCPVQEGVLVRSPVGSVLPGVVLLENPAQAASPTCFGIGWVPVWSM